MTNTEHLMAIAAEVGVNVDELPDTLETTLLKAIIEKSGGDTSALPDNLKSTLYLALADCVGGGGGGGGGGTTVAENDVNYIDYDGTVLYSYSTAEALSLADHPALPERKGLICQGWNWSFAEMQDYVSKNGKCDIGATYITDDGKTRLYISLGEGRTSPMLHLAVNGSVTVDWGDNTDNDVLTGTDLSVLVNTPNHHYAAAGDYVITLSVDGEFTFFSSDSSGHSKILRHDNSNTTLSRSYANSLIKVELGAGINTIGNYAFSYSWSFKNITIPNSVLSLGDYAFSYCNTLKCVVVPSSMTTINRYAFYYCYGLERMVLSPSTDKIYTYAFHSVHAMRRIVLPKKFPNGVSYLNSTFYSCYGLVDITLPDDMTKIVDNMFRSCSGITSMSFNSNVSSIGNSVFAYCTSIKFIDFSKHTFVPTLGSGLFNNASSDFEIRVPAALVDSWKAATNWSEYADKIVGV